MSALCIVAQPGTKFLLAVSCSSGCPSKIVYITARWLLRMFPSTRGVFCECTQINVFKILTADFVNASAASRLAFVSAARGRWRALLA